ncbi:MAG: hypothetical protein ACYS76_16080 [Planctomycetota bacterium]|jgi:hypothetical protein
MTKQNRLDEIDLDELSEAMASAVTLTKEAQRRVRAFKRMMEETTMINVDDLHVVLR